jgi:uncharacterized protein YdeI (YjbR/CyaY-like superfamily)
MEEKPLLYFKNTSVWREWLHQNYDKSIGVYLVFYKVDSPFESMRWEEAVQVAICYGWIDSTVKKIDEHSRKQLFTPRKPKSVWSKLNKTYIEQLIQDNLMHKSGLQKIAIAKQNGSWESLDEVENGIIPPDLQMAFDQNPIAQKHYQNFSPSYRKGYLYWLNMAKRDATRTTRIAEIIKLCEQNIKSRPGSF